MATDNEFVLLIWSSCILLVATFGSHVLGQVMKRVLRFPLVTGYLATGALMGPYVLDIVSKKDIPHLNYVTNCALAVIAFSAGAELYFPEIRRLMRVIIHQTFGITLTTFFIVTTVVLVSLPISVFSTSPSLDCTFGAAFMVSSVMVARSPSSALGIISELKCRGPVTTTCVAVTVVADVVVMLSFAITATITKVICGYGGADAVGLFIAFGSILLCFVYGIVIGCILLFLLWLPLPKLPKRLVIRRSHIRGLLIIATGQLAFIFANFIEEESFERLNGRTIALEPLLACMVGSILCANKSAHRVVLGNILHKVSPWIFMPFFTLTGCALNFSTFASSLIVTLLIVSARIVSVAIGSYSGARWLSRMEPKQCRYLWMTLTTQAGVTLGLANSIKRSFAASWGHPLSDALISCVVFNQFTGPFMFKFAMRKVGEAHDNEPGGHDTAHGHGHEKIEDEDGPKDRKENENREVMIVGLTPLSILVAKLLSKRGCIVQLLPDIESEDSATLRQRAETAGIRVLAAGTEGPMATVTAALKPASSLLLLLADQSNAERWANSFVDTECAKPIIVVAEPWRNVDKAISVIAPEQALCEIVTKRVLPEVQTDVVEPELYQELVVLREEGTFLPNIGRIHDRMSSAVEMSMSSLATVANLDQARSEGAV
eukprot:TRINITY_DN3072_c0_g1_i1.p1 TRINITY_DN3072_c0_g1~~TRINITY_DN3072_c0_g1_i1.p1  ORF type:complete len:660 (+),score=72.66 TRINITY_DN3072_c0_g1_i1:29-2008(+)